MTKYNVTEKDELMNTDSVLWKPDSYLLEKSYVAQLMKKMGVKNRAELWKKSVSDVGKFWELMSEEMGFVWQKKYEKVLNDSKGLPWCEWFVGGELNITTHCVDRHAQSSLAEKTAIIYESENGKVETYTYQQLFQQVNRAASALKASGINRGDVVGLVMPMVPETVIQIFALFKIGAIALPVFSGFGEDAISERLEQAKAKMVFTCDGTLRRGKKVAIREVAKAAGFKVSTVKKIVTVERLGRLDNLHPQEEAWSEWISKGSETKTTPLPSESTAILLFTSGTTGKPKGAVHTHVGCLATIAKEHRYAFNVDSESRFFWFTDIGWMMGPWEIIGATYWGATLVLYDGAPDFPNPSRVWELVEKHKLTHLGISPTLIRSLMKHGDEFVQSASKNSLKFLGSTGEPWDPESYQWYFEKVGQKKCPIINISGGTEVIGCLLSPLPIDSLKACSLGGPALGVDVDVFDESGHSIQGGIGHLVVRKPIPSMTTGFLNDSQRYLDTYFSKFENTWYHGDWARVDSEGQWFLHGRSDDTIKVAGKRIGPSEYESSLMESDSVAEAAAVGVPDSLKGEVCVCFVVLKPGKTAGDELLKNLEQLVVKSLGKALAAKSIHVIPELPKTRSGKIVRGTIRKAYLGEKTGDMTSVENPRALEFIRQAGAK